MAQKSQIETDFESKSSELVDANTKAFDFNKNTRNLFE